MYQKREGNSIGPIVNSGSTITSDERKADVFYKDIFLGHHLNSANFDSQWKLSVENSVQPPAAEVNHDLNRRIEIKEITDALQKLKGGNKSPDFDGVHPLMLSYSPEPFVIVLFILFNAVLTTTLWPWTKNKVILLKKPGKDDYTTTKSFRPITISSYVGKVLERILENRIRDFIEEKSILPNSQYGFRKNRSTSTYLTNMIATIQHQVKTKHSVSGLFLDLQKAFDSVWHKGLLFRLAECGLSGRILETISQFLYSRTVQIQVNDHLSDQKPCPLGLPQGSVLSPLLFILYTRDLLEEVNGLKLQFADDCSIISWAKDDKSLQEEMNNNGASLSSWLNKWRMSANCQKTDVLIFNGQINPPAIQGEMVQQATKTKVLGVIIEGNMSFKIQLEEAKSKASRKWNMLKSHIGAGMSMLATRKLLTTVIISKACYCAHLWDLNKEISMYNYLKETLRMSFKPPTEVVHRFANVQPMNIRYRHDRLSTIKQLMNTDNLDLLKSCSRSKLYTTFLSDIKALKDRQINMDNITLKDLNKTSIKRHCNATWKRRWEVYIRNNSQGTEGLLEELAGDISGKDIVREFLHIEPLTVGRALSLVAGHCNLLLHRYKLGLTYSPTCLCLEEDESPRHFVKHCTLFSNSMMLCNILPDTPISLSSIIDFIIQTGKFA